jgi:hypothetical protein
VNAAYGFGSDRALAVADAAHEWWLGAAIDRTLFRQSTLLIAEVYALRPVAGAFEVERSARLAPSMDSRNSLRSRRGPAAAHRTKL